MNCKVHNKLCQQFEVLILLQNSDSTELRANTISIQKINLTETNKTVYNKSVVLAYDLNTIPNIPQIFGMLNIVLRP